jgi:hypothetical protein
MFSNKFEGGIVYVFKVGMIGIILKILFSRSNFNFFQIFDPIFLQVFCCLHFSLILLYLSSIFFPKKNFQVKKI